jgi:predicted RNase H-like nuclease (RuvC/YqgF family)
MMKRIGELKAEVERLNNESDILQKCCEHQKNRIERLKAEVERLTKQAKGMSKAGWSLVNAHQYDASISYWNKCINDWQNADKGVQL